MGALGIPQTAVTIEIGGVIIDDERACAEIHKVGSKSRYKKLVVKLEVNGSNVDFVVDTGAEFSTIPLSTHKRMLSMTPIQPSSVILRQYDGSILPTKGELIANVSLGRQRETGRFIVVKKCRFSASPFRSRLVMQVTPKLAKDAVFPCRWRSQNTYTTNGQLDE